MDRLPDARRERRRSTGRGPRQLQARWQDEGRGQGPQAGQPFGKAVRRDPGLGAGTADREKCDPGAATSTARRPGSDRLTSRSRAYTNGARLVPRRSAGPGHRLVAEDQNVVSADDEQVTKLLAVPLAPRALVDEKIGITPKVQKASLRQLGQVTLGVRDALPAHDRLPRRAVIDLARIIGA